MTAQTIVHIQACLDAQDEQNEWKAQYPNHCTICGGAGWKYYSYDPSPVGVSLAAGFMQDGDPCAACLNKGICPRCGSASMFAGEPDDVLLEVCPVCGWKEGEAYASHECSCWEQEMEPLDYKEVYQSFGIALEPEPTQADLNRQWSKVDELFNTGFVQGEDVWLHFPTMRIKAIYLYSRNGKAGVAVLMHNQPHIPHEVDYSRLTSRLDDWKEV